MKQKTQEPAPENKPEDEEVDVEEVEIVSEEGGDHFDANEIFQRFVQNKKRGFKRTSPNSGSVPNNIKEYKCEHCGYIAEDGNNLKDHIIRVHKITRRPTAPEHLDERREPKQILYCHFWNNYGSCNYQEKTGRPCKFEHKQAPRCNFDGNCNRKACMFSHQNQNTDFLGRGQRSVRPPPPQPWQMLMQAMGFPGMNGRGQSQWGNQRRY